MDKMNITSAQYVEMYGQNNTIKIVVDGVTSSVPIVSGNKEYDEILRQVADGTLTIADAD